MRLSTYKKLVDSAMALPDRLEGADYFKSKWVLVELRDYSPREQALITIKKQARLDIKGLFSSELVELLSYIKGKL